MWTCNNRGGPPIILFRRNAQSTSWRRSLTDGAACVKPSPMHSSLSSSTDVDRPAQAYRRAHCHEPCLAGPTGAACRCDTDEVLQSTPLRGQKSQNGPSDSDTWCDTMDRPRLRCAFRRIFRGHVNQRADPVLTITASTSNGSQPRSSTGRTAISLSHTPTPYTPLEHPPIGVPYSVYLPLDSSDMKSVPVRCVQRTRRVQQTSNSIRRHAAFQLSPAAEA